jgi:hypothetical protein
MSIYWNFGEGEEEGCGVGIPILLQIPRFFSVIITSIHALNTTPEARGTRLFLRQGMSIYSNFGEGEEEVCSVGMSILHQNPQFF